MLQTASVNQFRDHLREFVDTVYSTHDPLMVTRRNGQNFVVLSAEDWEREQETLYILQNNSLMKQIAASHKTHHKGLGRRLTQAAQHEIDHL